MFVAYFVWDIGRSDQGFQSDIMQGINAWLLRLCALAPHDMQNGDGQQGALDGSCGACLQPLRLKQLPKAMHCSNASIHPSIHLFTHSLAHLFVCSLVRSLIQSFISSFVLSLVHSVGIAVSNAEQVTSSSCSFMIH